MKLVFLITLLATTAAFANTTDSVFKKDSALPLELKVEILEEVLKAYPCIFDYGLAEKKTEVTIDQVDQGVRDLYFHTELTANFTHDGYHPATETLIVKSARYDGANPSIDWTRVESVRGDIYCQ